MQRPSADPGSLDPRQYAEFLKVMQRSALRRRRHRPDTQQGGMPPAAHGTAPYARRLHRLRRPGCPACCAGGGPAAPAAGGGAAERGGGAAGDARLRRVQQRRAQPHRQPAHHDARRRAGGAGGRAVLGPGRAVAGLGSACLLSSVGGMGRRAGLLRPASTLPHAPALCRGCQAARRPPACIAVPTTAEHAEHARLVAVRRSGATRRPPGRPVGARPHSPGPMRLAPPRR